MNNQEKIEKLLSQFYEGVTTPEEEIYLYQLLIEQPNETDYTSEQLAFMAMLETSDNPTSDSWSEEDQQLADWLDSEIQEKKVVKMSFFSHFKQWQGYAATLLGILALGTFIFFKNREATAPLALKNGQTISQEEASQEMQKTLQLLADCFEYTGKATQKTSATFSEIHRVLDKSINKNINNKNNNKAV